MSPKQIRNLVGLAIVCGISAFSVGASAQTTYRAAVGCPSLAEAQSMTLEQLREACGLKTSTQSPPEESGGAGALSCNNLKTLALTRAAAGAWPEGQAAAAAFQQQCKGVGSDTIPVHTAPYQPATLDGVYAATRGYSDPNPGVDPSVCASMYKFEVDIHDGVVEFSSGGYTWRGRVTSNRWVLISRDGVDPLPIHPTAIIGPLDRAVMYNGYCGHGFFRIDRRIG